MVLQLPKGYEVHHEVELGVVIGRRCKGLAPHEVAPVIGGYVVALDLTAVNILVKGESPDIDLMPFNQFVLVQLTVETFLL